MWICDWYYIANTRKVFQNNSTYYDVVQIWTAKPNHSKLLYQLLVSFTCKSDILDLTRLATDLFFLLIILNARQKRASTIPPVCNRIIVVVTATLIVAMPVLGMPSIGAYPRIKRIIITNIRYLEW